MSDVSAISLPEPERAVILDLWGSAEAFALWQRDVLAAEVERRATARAQTEAQQILATAAVEVRDAMPSLFPDEQPAP